MLLIYSQIQNQIPYKFNCLERKNHTCEEGGGTPQNFFLASFLFDIIILHMCTKNYDQVMYGS